MYECDLQCLRACGLCKTPNPTREHTTMPPEPAAPSRRRTSQKLVPHWLPVERLNDYIGDMGVFKLAKGISLQFDMIRGADIEGSARVEEAGQGRRAARRRLHARERSSTAPCAHFAVARVAVFDQVEGLQLPKVEQQVLDPLLGPLAGQASHEDLVGRILSRWVG